MTLPHNVTMTIGPAINLSFRDTQSLNGVPESTGPDPP